MAGGRPTKYDPAMCDVIIELGKVGASKAEMALELDIAMSTFDVWQNENAQFSEAVKKAVSFSQGWWEKQGRFGTVGLTQNFNAASFKTNMTNRFRKDWYDSKDLRHSTPDGAIQLEVKTSDMDKMIIENYLKSKGIDNA